MTRIGLVHAVTPAIAPIHAAFARDWPQARLQDFLDDSLTAALEEDGGLTARIRERILCLAQVAAEGADAVLFTCTAFDDAIEEARVRVPVPLLKPNEAMYEAALTHGRRIGLLATFQPAVQTMEDALVAVARTRGIAVSVETVCVPEALAAARSGDVARHDALVAAAAPALRSCNVVLLAQFSTSTARAAVQRYLRTPVLSAPGAAVEALKAICEAKAGNT